MRDKDDKQDDFERQLRRQLDEHARGIDAAALSALRQARERALQAARRRRRIPVWCWPAGVALATASVLAAVMYRPLQDALPRAEPEPRVAVETADDLEIVTGPDEVGFYEDLEFLIWLEQQDHAG
jgi:hypothetical protein